MTSVISLSSSVKSAHPLKGLYVIEHARFLSLQLHRLEAHMPCVLMMTRVKDNE